ncbi:uncharacterized protein B0T15DRAFT_263683 [Chaetomium strumarium]|uniref:Secreted protein n=1 Tax=Chaetomium strumarium TaxID=1170767 RepID=A0AAJ0LZA3_9PEZI|nr:hypothetical protein B0T15DRAFT_263683 [Chaetomium strumarium]
MTTFFALFGVAWCLRAALSFTAIDVTMLHSRATSTTWLAQGISSGLAGAGVPGSQEPRSVLACRTKAHPILDSRHVPFRVCGIMCLARKGSMAGLAGHGTLYCCSSCRHTCEYIR